MVAYIFRPDLSQPHTHTHTHTHTDLSLSKLPPTSLSRSAPNSFEISMAASNARMLSVLRFESTQLHARVPTERFLLPEELLLIQGWPVHNSPVELHEHSNSVKASFAGNAFSSSVMMSVFCSLMAAIPWTELSTHDEGSADAEAEAREAAELLKFM